MTLAVCNHVPISVSYQDGNMVCTDIHEFNVIIVDKLPKRGAKKDVLYVQAPSLDMIDDGLVYIYMNKVFLPLKYLSDKDNGFLNRVKSRIEK